eukprot:2103966-Rhodomonas_salina.1
MDGDFEIGDGTNGELHSERKYKKPYLWYNLYSTCGLLYLISRRTLSAHAHCRISSNIHKVWYKLH